MKGKERIKIISETYKEILQHTGRLEQIFFAQRMRMNEGRADQLDVIDVDNGGGLRFQVLPGSGLDIGRLSLHGNNISFLSKAGFSNPAFYEPEGMNGIHTFAPGFLHTCGMRNSGLPCEADGETFGFHGRVGQTPAENISIRYMTGTDIPEIRISGSVREGWLFGPGLQLDREILIRYGVNQIKIKDQITNLAAKAEDVMMLYHFNLGYPFLNEHVQFVTSHEYEGPVDEHAKAHEDERYSFGPPAAGEPESCFYYRQKKNDDGESFAACLNPDMKAGIMICTDPEQLPLLCNWHSRAAGDYVMGIEPCTCHGDGRKAHAERGEMIRLAPYETREHELVIWFAENELYEKLQEKAEKINK